MAEKWTIDAVPETDRKPPPARRRIDWAQVLSIVVALVGVAALGASGWVYSATQRDFLRLATDVAQLRLSLDLYVQQGPAAGVTPQSGESADATLLDLSNRIAILEQDWRDNAAATASAPAALPAIPATTADSGDCLPTGTRFMVAAGDSYPVCGASAVIEIGAVDNGFITLADGTVIAQGGNIAMPGTGCMLGVVPSDGGSLSGFAEIRVTC